MKKKLQVFISSTYTDMIEERQTAVSAVLNSGHIPAGMELFKSGDQSQKETIKRWIDESDVYMLILGGRYGSIDEATGKSYTHWEYDYAGEIGKRRFAVVIDEARLIEKAKVNPDYMERENYQKYNDFKREVLGNIIRSYEDLKDIKIVVMESLKDFESDDKLVGWVKADQISNVEDTLKENAKLLKENAKFKTENETLKERQNQNNLINGWDYEELKNTLSKTKIQMTETLSETEEELSLLICFVKWADFFSVGVTNSSNNSEGFTALYYEVAPKFLPYGLLEKVKVAGAKYEQIQTSKEGFKFLANYHIQKANQTS
ncbi:DUF4062 domain-containing protein [Paenibacillus macquariensis]|uniref:DUF4062 domain-containing protein n=1 Tax=Paenibacillus macquariensis TaxID=948756 RepID=A0ABY1K1G8_9BACL|nr:DUF4062 domain-containing protein [Paenibacillus macquariensis]MEC0091795.1 DUF4062 domain-containing protein [Paenibacillus macquariensis]OAB32293.1 hypothetical protein PMSM_16930 [Paenibacillus macquariensis subsp. macquariensis]SIR11832.1 protein of unknown function [Paenibacillus macquariensis]